jgi:hypothetical protein
MKKKKKDMIKDAAELLEDMDDAFLDYTLEEFGNWEEAFDLIDRARTFLTDYLNQKAAP